MIGIVLVGVGSFFGGVLRYGLSIWVHRALDNPWFPYGTLTVNVLGCLFIGESDRHAGMLLYEWIVRTARDHGLAGATVLRGVEGFGARSRVRTAKILELSTDLPIIVEIVDTAEK